MLVGVIALVLVGLLLSKTRSGKEMRALSDNLPPAEVSGLDTQRVIVITWVVARSPPVSPVSSRRRQSGS